MGRANYGSGRTGILHPVSFTLTGIVMVVTTTGSSIHTDAGGKGQPSYVVITN